MPDPNEKQASIRDIAVQHHHEVVDEFQRRYAAMEDDRFASAFSYGRTLLDEDLVDHLRRLPAGSSVLDIGCGTGEYLQRIAGLGHEPFGLEPANAMREVAIANNPDVDIRDGVASALPYADSTFDFVFAIEVLRYLDQADIGASLREMFRVLRPGGRVWFTMVNRFSLDGFAILEQARRRLIGGSNNTHPHCEFYTPREAKVALSAVGFSDPVAYGVMIAPLRVAYKVSSGLAPLLATRLESVDRRFSGSRVLSPVSGHLVASAGKDAP